MMQDDAHQPDELNSHEDILEGKVLIKRYLLVLTKSAEK